MRVPVYERRSGIAPLSIPHEQAMPQIGDNGESAGKNLQGLFAKIQEIQNGMEDARTLELFNKFKMDSQEYHEHPDTGIYNTRLGYKSYNVYKDADEWLRRKGEDYARELPSRRAQANFRKMAREHIMQRGQQNSRFEADQVRKYERDTADASIKNSLAYAERNWNNPAAIEQARKDIAQALELKHRGSGAEIRKEAWAEIEDQLGVARIRQAFLEHPLKAAEMLDDKDIHLKPETRAKLVNSLKNSTEVYEIQAIVQEYAKSYSPENAVEAQNVLINRYGPDKGQKAFSALAHFWSINTYQNNARDKAKLETQQKNAKDLLARFNDPSKPNPTLQEILSSNIDPQTAHSLINLLKQEEKDKAKATQSQRDIEIWSMETRGEFFTDEQLEEFVRGGILSDDDARKHQAHRAEYQNRKERERNKTLQQNRQALFIELMDGTLTENRINEEMARGNIEPDDAHALLGHLRAENKFRESNDEQARKQAMAERHSILMKYINKGIVVPRETIEKWHNKQKIIDDRTAQMLYSHLDTYNKTLKAEQEEQAREQAKIDKEKRKDELDEKARTFALNYWDNEGQAMRDIDNNVGIEDLNLTREEKDYFRQRVTQRIKDAKQQKLDIDNRFEKALAESLYAMELDIIHNVKTQKDVDDYRQRFNLMLDNGDFGNDDKAIRVHRELMSMLDNYEKAFKKAATDKQRDEDYAIATDYAERFGLDGEHDARKELREKYADAGRAEKIITLFDRLIQDKRSEKTQQDKAHKEQQDKLFAERIEEIRRSARPINDEILENDYSKDNLTFEQVERIRRLNAALNQRQGIENTLSAGNINNFNSLGYEERQTMIAQYMGITPDMRLETLQNLFRRAYEGNLTDYEIEFNRTSGRIWDSDAEDLKKFDTKFERGQRAIINLVAKDLQNAIAQLYSGSQDTSEERSKAINIALTDFNRLALDIDLHAKNFQEAVKNIFTGVMETVISDYSKGKDLTKSRWGFFGDEVLTGPGERIRDTRQGIRNYDVPTVDVSFPFMTPSGDFQTIKRDGNITSYDNTVPLPIPEEQPQSGNVQPRFEEIMARYAEEAQENITPLLLDPNISLGNSYITPPPPPTPPTLRGVIDTAKSILGDINYAVSSGFSWATTALRNGRPHPAIDCAVPVGTPVRVPKYGGNWKVSAVGEDATAGKFVKISTTLASGDTYEYTLAHLSSINVSRGDDVSMGSVIAKSGNTGYSTGPHLHIGLKVNGKPVDPRNVDVGNGTGATSGDFVPQTLVPPVVMSSQDQAILVRQIIGLQTLGLVSDDNVISTTPWEGLF